jgi:hypothetical protein
MGGDVKIPELQNHRVEIYAFSHAAAAKPE